MREPYAPGAFWFSKLSDARQCLRLYKYKHIDGLAGDEANGDLAFGSAMHLGINDVLKGGDGLRIFAIYWESVKGLQFGRFSHEELKSMGEVFLVRFKRLHAKHYEPFQMEERVYGKMGPHEFEGTPDFLGKYKGRKAVVDFKTAGYKYDKRKILCDEQMPGYAALAEKELGFKPEIAVYCVFVKDRTAPSIQVLEIELTEQRQYDILSNIIETCEDLEGRKVFPMNTSNCIRGSIVCPFFEKCHGKGVKQDE
jgi:hypothetical protein